MRRFLKWTGILVGIVLLLALIAAGGLFVVGGSKFVGPTDLPAESLAITGDSAQLARGAHIGASHGCESCHGEGLGGTILVDAPPFRVVASNLTTAGVGAKLDVAGLERGIRHGVGSDGRALAIMPSELYKNLSDDETAALIAWMQSLPPVQNELPETKIKPLGRIIAGTGSLPTAVDLIGAEAPHTAVAPPMAVTLEYGRYRASTLCVACHGQRLEGAQPPDPSSPPAPPLMNAATWTLNQFRTAMRTGQTPTRQLDDMFMPYTVTAHLTDEEIEALHMYMRSL
jgi:cytochrome c553